MRDRDIFQDSEGRVFVVLGFIQPSDRVLSFLKYVRDPEGRWSSEGIRYRRLFWGSVDSVTEGFPELPSEYITKDPHFETLLIEPPLSAVARHFRPEKRLQEILNRGPQDRLETYVKRAATAIHDVLGIPLENIGVAGSILWGAHNPESDVNMNVYGLKYSRLLSESLDRLSELDGFELRKLPDWRRAMERVRSRIPVLSETDLENLFSRRQAFCIDGQCIGTTPVVPPEEAPIQYLSERYRTISDTPERVEAVIEEDRYGLFSPAVYAVDAEIANRVMVYDGAFSGLFKRGDAVEVSGALQKIIAPDGSTTGHHLIVGTKSGSGKEFIRFME